MCMVQMIGSSQHINKVGLLEKNEMELFRRTFITHEILYSVHHHDNDNDKKDIDYCS